MANYATLKAAIAAAIRENGNNEITGNLLQQQLLAIVNSLGAGYQYAGIATPETNPGTPDQNVFYIASTPGTYANFDSLVLSDGDVAILKYNGAWTKENTGAASISQLNNAIESVLSIVTKEQITPTVEKKINGYYVDTTGHRQDYSQFSIFGGIPVKKGDFCTAIVSDVNSAVSPLAFSTTNSYASDMNCQQVIPFVGGKNQYEGVAQFDGYVFITSGSNSTPTLTIKRMFDFATIEENIANLSIIVEELSQDCETLFDETQKIISLLLQQDEITLSIERQSYYVDTTGHRQYYSQFSIYTPIPVQKGDILEIGNIDINAAVCPVAYSLTDNTNSDMVCQPLAVYSPTVTSYRVEAPENGYIIVSNATNQTPTVIRKRYVNIDQIKKSGNLLSERGIMLFGDSLTAGSTTGVVSFGKVIAERLGVPYRAFVYDRFDPSPDTNNNDIDVNYPCVTNYAKDGTKNEITPGRVDSILQRIKNHIKIDTPVSYILVECSINDYTSGTKGQISPSYTEEFDVNTAIGAIEETCRYLTTLGKDIRIGFYIPWGISYVPENYFDDYIPVFEKWGVPLLDLRKCAGFEMHNCVRHRELYSLPASSYANYDNTTVYNLDDKVKYNGYLYKCNADNVVGILPTNTTYWTQVSDGNFDGCHLNTLGHWVVAGKIQQYIERL